MGLLEATQFLSAFGYSVFLFRDGNRALLNSRQKTKKKKKHNKAEHNTSTQCSLLASNKAFVLGLPEEGLKNLSLNKNLDSSRTNFTTSTKICTEDKRLSRSDVYNLFRSCTEDTIGIENDQVRVWNLPYFPCLRCIHCRIYHRALII